MGSRQQGRGAWAAGVACPSTTRFIEAVQACSCSPVSLGARKERALPTPTPHTPPPPRTTTPESEYALLLEAISRGGTYAQFASVLARMQAELNQLRPSTLAVAARFFASPAAAAAFAPGGPMAGRGSGWGPARWVSVDADGLSAEAGEAAAGGDLGLTGSKRLARFAHPL